MQAIILYNTTLEDIEIEELGVTVPAEDTCDVGYFSQPSLASATTLYSHVENGTITIVQDETDVPMVMWSVTSALELLRIGVTSFQVGLQKAASTGIVEGNFYSAATQPSDTAVGAIGTGYIYGTPVSFMGSNFNRIGVDVTTARAGGSIRLGIYSNNVGKPGSLLLDAGYVPTDTAGNKEIAIAFHSPMDWYWLVATYSHDIETRNIVSGINNAVVSQSSTNSASALGFGGAHSFGALPADFPTPTERAGSIPMVWIRKVA